jgi:hypothetical protein
VLAGNEIRGNFYGRGGADLNGRDVAYDGEGRNNCVQESGMLSPSEPADRSTFEPCPFSGSNEPVDQAAQQAIVQWSSNARAQGHDWAWIRHPHQAIKGIRPLVTCTVVKKEFCKGQPRK